MADFASLDTSGQTIPFSGGSVNPMQLTTPYSMITGNMAGSQQNVFKIITSNTTTLSYSFPSHAATSTGADVATVSINYSLGGITPIIQAYYTVGSVYSAFIHGGIYNSGLGPSGQTLQYFSISGDSGGASFSFIQSFVTTSGTINAQSGTFTIKYYLLQESAK